MAQGDRFRFASAMSHVDEGTSRDEVLSLLGPPDDIRTLADKDADADQHAGLLYETTEMWCYGTDRHLGFPTLGHLYFTELGIVHHHHAPTMPVVEVLRLFPEEELRGLLRLLDQAPPPSSDRFQPRLLVQIVNRLQPLGKDKVLAAVTEYLRIAPYYGFAHARPGLFLVLRVLFDLPDGMSDYPVMHIGSPTPPPPTDGTSIPRFPLTLSGDIPLLLVCGYCLRDSDRKKCPRS
jgi:hypothetical protein